jgi:DNA helicase-2/ATP-dependent DNA helicase PcrA
MIPSDQFVPLLQCAIPRFQRTSPNANQQACVLHDPRMPLMIVAGPGTGKTTVLVLRALRLVFVDGLMPEEIILTTFTKKAAAEIRARLIEWGLALLAHLQTTPPPGAQPTFTAWLDRIDINRFVTGTLDSICEDALGRYRDPLDTPAVVIEGFVANAMLLREGLFPAGAHTNRALAAYLSTFTFNRTPPSNLGDTLTVARTLIDRFVHDQVDLGAYRTGLPHTAGRDCIADAATGYWNALSAESRLDFALLEQAFLMRLRSGRLARMVAGIRALLVDEYQDTNPLQESIYFELVRLCNATFTIVGDDDQSLYRFRGATIELFRDFVARFAGSMPGMPPPSQITLVDNYRSTPEIVQFFNVFLTNDSAFAPARVQPPKAPIVATIQSNGLRVLGMFRPDAATLAGDMSDFLWAIFRGAGYAVPRTTISITRDRPSGDFGDAVVLSHTVNEFAGSFGGGTPRERLPRLVRQNFAARGLGVFNPRGRALRDIPEVQSLLGTMLECIDPRGAIQGTFNLRAEAFRYLDQWRTAAQQFIATNPMPVRPHALSAFVRAWQTRTSQTTAQWPDEWPLLELCFKLLAWLPLLRDDPEGQVYLEAVTRAIAQAATFSSYRSTIVHGRVPHADNSVKSAIRDIFAPIAEGDVDVDEEIMPSVPRDRLCFMTIHQAKGLEFPLVIVDVSSDYRTNHRTQRFRRFPIVPSVVQEMEDDLAPYSAIGPLRTARPPLSRTFDDLVRLHYVAYSRPEAVLLLVGLDTSLQYNSSIQNVATAWRADGTWGWQSPVPPGRPPAQANNIPLHLI